MTSLANQVALITGASSGIGTAVARELDRAGMKLVLTGRNVASLKRVAESCVNAAVVVGDIADPQLPQVLLETALASFGQLDVCFNNAGVMETGPVESVDIDRICAMVRVNVEAAYRLAYVALKHFKKQNSGYLINTSSIAGTKVRDTIGAYAGTKYAIEAFTEALRIELAKTGVRVAVIQPGLVETHLQDHFPVHPKVLMNITKMVQPEDVARCVRFVLEQPEHVRIPKMLIMPSGQPM
jgi:NADP-dependent 3-hydroxy acid dehydrogenase YdfG